MDDVPRPRTASAGLSDARSRIRSAAAYRDVARLVIDEPERAEFLNVAAGVAVLSGIAAADAICARRLGQVYRGDDHRGAADLLSRATPDGAKLAAVFRRLLDLKDEALYGVGAVSATKAKSAVRWADHLVSRGREEVER